MFRLASPWLLMLAVPCLAAAWFMMRRRRIADARIRLPMASSRVKITGSPWVRIEGLLPWMRALVLVLIVVALARPQSGARIENVSTLGVDIAIALDISGSMKSEDLAEGESRLAVARETIRRFVSGRPGDRIGLVAFASLAATRCPLTTDHEMLDQFLDGIDFAPDEQAATAMGMGLATAVNRLRESDAKSKVAVLATDGVNNAGQIGPKAAAEAARALGVKVYTIGVGTQGDVPFPIQTHAGKRYRYERFPLDEELLQEVADLTGGQYFRATDAESLQAVFSTIDSLEKTRIESRIRVLYSELFSFVLVPALLLLLLERALAATRLRRIP